MCASKMFTSRSLQVANSAILDCSDVTDMEGKDFLDPKIDPGVVLIEDQ